MKYRLTILLITCTALAAMGPHPAHAEVDISASIQINSPTDFYQPLTSYGSWVDVAPYGRCWRPTEVGADWQPYTVGYWQWTDAGWYWQSDEPWAWACYHYGSWYNEPSTGWIWIPGTEWAPAWVTWRDNDDYIGWAPCGPDLAVLAPSFFVFCDIHHFHDHFHHRRDFIVNNTTIINRTRVIKDFHRESIDIDGRQRTIFANRGPGVDPIQKATGQHFTPRPVRDVIIETPRPREMRHDEGRPEQRPNEQRRETPPPTGREEHRNYQQPAQRNVEPPRAPEQRTPVVPQQRPEVNPPTGREQPRVYREVPSPNTPPEQRREIPAPQPRRDIPTPEPRPIAPPERVLPPTGREEAPRIETRPAPPAQAPRVREAPVAPPGPADGGSRDGGRDGGRDGRDR
jgi:hypothetical protein